VSGLVCKNFINFTLYIFNMLSDIDKDLLTVLQGTLHKLLSFKIHSSLFLTLNLGPLEQLLVVLTRAVVHDQYIGKIYI